MQGYWAHAGLLGSCMALALMQGSWALRLMGSWAHAGLLGSLALALGSWAYGLLGSCRALGLMQGSLFRQLSLTRSDLVLICKLTYQEVA
jgi:hypothetical protein